MYDPWPESKSARDLEGEYREPTCCLSDGLHDNPPAHTPLDAPDQHLAANKAVGQASGQEGSAQQEHEHWPEDPLGARRHREGYAAHARRDGQFCVSAQQAQRQVQAGDDTQHERGNGERHV